MPGGKAIEKYGIGRLSSRHADLSPCALADETKGLPMYGKRLLGANLGSPPSFTRMVTRFARLQIARGYDPTVMVAKAWALFGHEGPPPRIRNDLGLDPSVSKQR